MLAWSNNICPTYSPFRTQAGRLSYSKPSQWMQSSPHGMHMQVMTMSCGTSEGMYQLLPGREAYQQQEPFLLGGFATLLAGCDHGAMHALVQRHPDMRSLVIQRVSAICRPGYDPVSACNALQSLTALLQVCCLHYFSIHYKTRRMKGRLHLAAKMCVHVTAVLNTIHLREEIGYIIWVQLFHDPRACALVASSRIGAVKASWFCTLWS